jgi:5-formyltetrahydrofolate cyclo-ligase
MRERKRALRRRARLSDLAASPERNAAVVARLCELPVLSSARCVSLYAALPGELDLLALARILWNRGALVLFPRIEGRDLALVPVAEERELSPGAHGIREPSAAHSPVPVERVDVFVLPGLFFDRAGRRLGRGRGYYDRLLIGARAGATRIGVCLAERLIGDVPCEPWDEPVHWIATDAELAEALPRPRESPFPHSRRQQ